MIEPAAGEKFDCFIDFGWQGGDFKIRFSKSDEILVFNQSHLVHAANFKFCKLNRF